MLIITALRTCSHVGTMINLAFPFITEIKNSRNSNRKQQQMKEKLNKNREDDKETDGTMKDIYQNTAMSKMMSSEHQRPCYQTFPCLHVFRRRHGQVYREPGAKVVPGQVGLPARWQRRRSGRSGPVLQGIRLDGRPAGWQPAWRLP